MRRRLLNLLTALSLLLCVAVVALWVRSRSRDDHCVYTHEKSGGEIIGRFSVYIFTEVHVDETVLYELYGNGQYWSYAYHN